METYIRTFSTFGTIFYSYFFASMENPIISGADALAYIRVFLVQVPRLHFIINAGSTLRLKYWPVAGSTCAAMRSYGS